MGWVNAAVAVAVAVTVTVTAVAAALDEQNNDPKLEVLQVY